MQSEQAQKLLGEQADAPKNMTQDQPVKLHLGETGKSIFLGAGIPLQESLFQCHTLLQSPSVD